MNKGTAGRCAIAGAIMMSAAMGEEIARGPVYSVIEIGFQGPRCGPGDAPARDAPFSVLFRHEAGAQSHIQGFWDGDGRGGTTGDRFAVRFCPTAPGRWQLAEVRSEVPGLSGQHRGDHVIATPSDLHGFWIVDERSPGKRWFRRSDGSHQYVIGNTHYSFLSGRRAEGVSKRRSIVEDIAGNAEVFKKLRFGLNGDYYPDPDLKPFFDQEGRPTDSGDHSHRPNPAWFRMRVDVAVQAAFDRDLIADLILAGPDTEASRATLRALGNNGDAAPFLRYISARYASYPNVWLCLFNEYDIRTPKYVPADVARFGAAIRPWLATPTPLSAHATPPLLWSTEFDRLDPWADHMIIQKKLRDAPASADVIAATWRGKGRAPRDMPTVNDELSYQGAGDKHSEADTISAHVGAFLGGGYGTTGHKSGNKLGQYFWGDFDPTEHSAAASLGWLRATIDGEVRFWALAPDVSIFADLPEGARGLADPGREYVLGTDRAHRSIVATLPPGSWRVRRHDVIARRSVELAADAAGRFVFDAPEGRAVLFHFAIATATGPGGESK